MKTLHRIAALLLLLFVLVHIGNHVAAAIGPKTYNAYLATARIVYRNPIVEPLLIALIGAQAITGFSLIIKSFQRDEKRSLASWFEIFSAVGFVIFIIIHLSAIAVTRFYFEVQTDFYWVAEMFRAGALQPFIIGFHFLGIMTVTIHAGIGLKYMFDGIGLGKIGRTAAVTLIVAGFAASVIALSAYSGQFYPIELNG